MSLAGALFSEAQTPRLCRPAPLLLARLFRGWVAPHLTPHFSEPQRVLELRFKGLFPSKHQTKRHGSSASRSHSTSAHRSGL